MGEKAQQTERWCKNQIIIYARPNFVPTRSKHYPDIVPKRGHFIDGDSVFKISKAIMVKTRPEVYSSATVQMYQIIS